MSARKRRSGACVIAHASIYCHHYLIACTRSHTLLIIAGDGTNPTSKRRNSACVPWVKIINRVLIHLNRVHHSPTLVASSSNHQHVVEQLEKPPIATQPESTPAPVVKASDTTKPRDEHTIMSTAAMWGMFALTYIAYSSLYCTRKVRTFFSHGCGRPGN